MPALNDLIYIPEQSSQLTQSYYDPADGNKMYYTITIDLTSAGGTVTQGNPTEYVFPAYWNPIQKALQNVPYQGNQPNPNYLPLFLSVKSSYDSADKSYLITATASGGRGAQYYRFSLDNGAFGQTNSFRVRSSGTYVVTVKDADHTVIAPVSQSVVIKMPSGSGVQDEMKTLSPTPEPTLTASGSIASVASNKIFGVVPVWAAVAVVVIIGSIIVFMRRK